VVKTRSLAQKLAVSGRVRVNREKCDSASHPLKVGDVLTITLERRVQVLKVVRPGTRRGPPADARLLYEDLSPPPVAQPAGVTRDPGSGRPTKRDHRVLLSLKRQADDDFPPRDE
jgi:ribosome-associated heat shock protein Hsp15